MKKILLLAGGGGHTGYAYSLSQYLKESFELSYYIPEGDYLSEKRLRQFLDFGDIKFIAKGRDPDSSNFLFPFKFAKALVQSAFIKKYDLIISLGSNFCLPPCFFAWLKHIPIINLECAVRFTKPAKTVDILKHIALTVIQWEDQKKILPNGVKIGVVMPKPEYDPWNGKYLLVTGGSQGHKKLFDLVDKIGLKRVVLHTGSINNEAYRKHHPEWVIFNDSEDINEDFQHLLAGAEVIVTHFGTTVLEALSYGKPIVIVVNPEWRRTVGYEDAQLLAERVNGVLLEEMNIPSLLDAIDEARKKSNLTFQNGGKNLTRLIVRMLYGQGAIIE